MMDGYEFWDKSETGSSRVPAWLIVMTIAVAGFALAKLAGVL